MTSIDDSMEDRGIDRGNSEGYGTGDAAEGGSHPSRGGGSDAFPSARLRSVDSAMWLLTRVYDGAIWCDASARADRSRWIDDTQDIPDGYDILTLKDVFEAFRGMSGFRATHDRLYLCEDIYIDTLAGEVRCRVDEGFNRSLRSLCIAEARR